MTVARPTPWALPPDGFHFEAAEDSPDWRLASDDEIVHRRCRHSTRNTCPNPVAAALNRGKWWNGERRDSWWHYCEEHLYGRWIEDGKVMRWRLVRDEEHA